MNQSVQGHLEAVRKVLMAAHLPEGQIEERVDPYINRGELRPSEEHSQDAGAGGFCTTATSPSDLAGPINTYNFNVGVGPAQVSGQFGYSGDTWIGSITVGPGIGISGDSYPTNTWAH